MVSATLFALLCFSLVILLFKMAPKYSAEVLVSVDKHKDLAVMCLMETIHVFSKLRSNMSYSTVGGKFTVNQSTICIK